MSGAESSLRQDESSEELEILKHKYVSMRISDQLFGMRVERIEDILMPQVIAPIPLAPEEILGAINLRGRVVTVIDMKIKMKFKKKEEVAPAGNDRDYRCVVVSEKGELYSIVVDKVMDIMDMAVDDMASIPENLPKEWKELCDGVYSMEKELMMILNVDKLMASYEQKEENDEAVGEGE